ncbi:hypothetical protein AAL_01326 [Moelleriella libera RCEF 2490]|uniref:Uncharacterized protein n=1 Tax=Moelleriella libera RCEF 2490 TaxID=1081109 RepID=A0A166U395_9HYPO|nr:hypothetical protein AAL_01326 [Moelleriella libera RCEF 2490]
MTQERPPTNSLAEDIIAILHSYGGQIGTNSLAGLGSSLRAKQGLAGGISKLIYLCGYAVPERRYMIQKVVEMGHEALVPIAFDFADDMSMFCRDPRGQVVGPGVEEEEVESYVASLMRWNG